MSFVEKQLLVLPPTVVAGRHVKRYHVNNDASPIDEAIEAAAYAMVPGMLPPRDATPPAAFVVLHRGGDGGAYVNTYTWVWDNVLHCATAGAAQPMIGCPDDDPTHFVPITTSWIGCIWELPALGHERSAWVRHMIAAERPDLDAYLADSLPAGPTGGATGGPGERAA
jgi:hypothetical protein